MLTDLAVRKAVAREKPYKLSDGGGLYLLVTKAGQRCWRVDYRFGEKRATAALGVYPTVSLAEARAKATYAVAKEKCDDFSGDTKDICVKEAKAAQTRSMADIKAGKDIAEVRQDANEDKMKASKEAAEARCETLAGNAKDACMDKAKMNNTPMK